MDDLLVSEAWVATGFAPGFPMKQGEPAYLDDEEDTAFELPPPPEPTGALPGTREKVAVMTWRTANHFAPTHPLDALGSPVRRPKTEIDGLPKGLRYWPKGKFNYMVDIVLDGHRYTKRFVDYKSALAFLRMIVGDDKDVSGGPADG